MSAFVFVDENQSRKSDSQAHAIQRFSSDRIDRFSGVPSNILDSQKVYLWSELVESPRRRCRWHLLGVLCSRLARCVCVCVCVRSFREEKRWRMYGGWE